MGKTAFLFPGQGSQIVGMGKELYQESADVRELFDMAEDITRTHLARFCFQGPMEELTRTVNLQPALTVVNLAILSFIKKQNIIPDAAAGHSLGEYCALTAASVLSNEDTLRAVNKRGTLMHRESERFKGAMSAVIGLSFDQVAEEITRQSGPADKKGFSGKSATIANHNAATQVVISGDPESVKLLGERLKAKGGRVMALKVSGAWHSPLISGAVNEFTEFLSSIPFSSPVLPVIFNVSADGCFDSDMIRNLMAEQLTSPVRWYDSMKKMVDSGVQRFVEVGSGNVLTGLMKRIVPDHFTGKLYAVNDMKSLELFFKDVI